MRGWWGWDSEKRSLELVQVLPSRLRSPVDHFPTYLEET